MKIETKVGLLFFVALVLVLGFVFFISSFNPFSNSNTLDVTYNYAGGIEVGSGVRVMGIRVGKVESIDFEPGLKDESGEEVKLKIKISISKKAWPTVRKDSRFYINMAGIIGERFLEISPGSTTSEELQPGQLIRGEDPPRIDQLISQSYGLAGKIIDIVEKNEGNITQTIESLDKLVTNFNKTLEKMDKVSRDVEIGRILKNVDQISTDVAFLTKKLRSEDSQKTMDLVHRLLWRLEPLDGPAIKKFLQEEGIRAKLF